MSSMKLKVKGFDDMLETINKMGLSAHNSIEKALLESHNLVTNQIKQELIRYKENTGEMKESFLDNSTVVWVGETASVAVGFNQNKSMHATYMMITGTPYREPDKKLYNAIYGAKTKKAVKEIQEQALMRVIEGGNK